MQDRIKEGRIWDENHQTLVVWHKVEGRRQQVSKVVYEQRLHDAAWALLGSVLLAYLQVELDQVTIIRNQYGKPSIKEYQNIQFNISHTEGLVACVISDTEIGLDVERIRDFTEPVLQKVCSKEEVEGIRTAMPLYTNEYFFRLWTLKESYIKAVGQGLSIAMRSVVFDLSGGELKSQQEGYLFKQYKIEGDYLITYCQKER